MENSGEKEYVLAFAGTDGIRNIDMLHNFLQILGQSDQYRDAIDLAKEAVAELGIENITLVGHSLGGGLSAAGSYATGAYAMTFNAATVSPFTIYENKFAKIDAYVTTTDPLHWFQKHLGFHADGKIHYVKPKDSVSGFPLFKGHKIENFY